MAWTDWGLVEPFDIDHGELDGLTPQMGFVLGVEWQQFRQALLTNPEPFLQAVHTANEARLLSLCQRHGRPAKSTWLHDDHEGHRVLHVPEDPNAED